MTEKLNPEALAQWDDNDDREGIQVVTQAMILNHILYENELPPESAEPFSVYLHEEWFEFGNPDDPAQTNAEVIAGALAFWRGV